MSDRENFKFALMHMNLRGESAAKPTLRKFKGRWFCLGKHCITSAATPTAAYQDWCDTINSAHQLWPAKPARDTSRDTKA